MQNFENVLEKERLYHLEQVKKMLNSNAKNIKEMCKKAQLMPKRDTMGNVYFSKEDISALKKVYELHQKTLEMQNRNTGLTREVRSTKPSVQSVFSNLESNIVKRFTAILDKKMNGFDEIIMELVRAKTENETLRQRVNELNKENFKLKNEVVSYRPLALGLYVKKDTDDFIL